MLPTLSSGDILIYKPFINKKGPIKEGLLVIINHPEDAERICKNHVKKAPVFKSFLYNSIISLDHKISYE